MKVPLLTLAAIAGVALFVTSCGAESSRGDKGSDDPSAISSSMAGAASLEPTTESVSESSKSEPPGPPPPGRWERQLRRVMAPLGVTELEAPELDFRSSNLVGAWRERAVKVAYYTDPVHGIDPKRAGVRGTTTTIEVAGILVTRVDWAGFSASLLKAACGDDFYEVTVFDGPDPYVGDPDDVMTEQLMSDLLKSPACSR